MKHFFCSKDFDDTKVNKKNIGAIGEYFAATYLTDNGYGIIKRNWKCKSGEIDIIATENEYLVFVEVKTRRNSSLAEERLLDTITWRKIKKLRFLSQVYIKYKYRTPMVPAYRVDVLGIILDPKTLTPISYKLIKGISFE